MKSYRFRQTTAGPEATASKTAAMLSNRGARFIKRSSAQPSSPAAMRARWAWGWGWGLGAFAIGALIGAALWRPAYSYYYPARVAQQFLTTAATARGRGPRGCSIP